jgi:hypothetical protein
MSKCSMFSSSWSHKRHLSGCWRPRWPKRSAVQHRLWATNHMKKRHLGGAQDFQILSYGLKEIAPWNRASLADRVVYCPEEESHQMCLSWTPTCKFASEITSHKSRYSIRASGEIEPWMSSIHLSLIRGQEIIGFRYFHQE